MRSAQRPFQLLDPLLLLDIGLRGCASPPKRSLGSGFHFVFPTVIEIGSDLVFAARLSHVAALQNLQHNLPLLFRGSLDSRLSRHSRLLAEAPSLTNFRVQFYWGALQVFINGDFDRTIDGDTLILRETFSFKPRKVIFRISLPKSQVP